LRVDGNSPTRLYGYGQPRPNGAAGSVFAPEAEAPASGPVGAAPIAGTTGIEALLALQAIDEPVLARRKAVRRGRALLDTLDELKADLLIGRVSEGRLNQLLALVGQAREQTIPDLDATLDEIELRARVELAKHGHDAIA
jgi:hypothetical protein